MTIPRSKVCVIGAGNVATHLSQALKRVADVVQVVALHEESAQRLSKLISPECEAVTDLSRLRHDADYYLVAVSDDSIKDVVAATAGCNGIWMHTSGSVPASVFAGIHERYGVFYPLQTFTRDLKTDISQVPFFVEGSTPEVTESIRALASALSTKVEFADSDRRRILHLAAVFACNFANQMWVEADDILRSNGLSIDYLMPLLRVTLDKLNSISPQQAMTGPAVRGDEAVMESQMTQLTGVRRELYRMISQRIIETSQKRN